MAIISLVPDFAGQIGDNPRRVKMVTTDSLATITTAGYLNSGNLQGFAIYPTDFLDVVYSFNTFTNTGTNSVLVVTISNGVITLSLDIDEGNVLLPVINGNVPIFNGTSGQIKDSGASLSSGSATHVVTTAGSVSSGNMPTFTDANGTLGSSGVASNTVLAGSFALPDLNANLIMFSASASAVQLAAAGSVTIISSSGTKQYKIITLAASLLSPVSFSGGGGDRTITISDGTTAYTVVAAATIQAALANGAWGSTQCPLPAGGAAMDTATQPGANVVIKYNGGAADYTAGNIHFYGLCVRVV